MRALDLQGLPSSAGQVSIPRISSFSGSRRECLKDLDGLLVGRVISGVGDAKAEPLLRAVDGYKSAVALLQDQPYRT